MPAAGRGGFASNPFQAPRDTQPRGLRATRLLLPLAAGSAMKPGCRAPPAGLPGPAQLPPAPYQPQSACARVSCARQWPRTWCSQEGGRGLRQPGPKAVPSWGAGQQERCQGQAWSPTPCSRGAERGNPAGADTEKPTVGDSAQRHQTTDRGAGQGVHRPGLGTGSPMRAGQDRGPPASHEEPAAVLGSRQWEAGAALRSCHGTLSSPAWPGGRAGAGRYL